MRLQHTIDDLSDVKLMGQRTNCVASAEFGHFHTSYSFFCAVEAGAVVLQTLWC